MRDKTQRWIGFAQAMRARHARIARRHHPSAMTLAHPRAWRVVSNAFHSHSHVSVQVRMPDKRPGALPPVVRNLPSTRTIREQTPGRTTRDVVYRERMLLTSRSTDGRGAPVQVRKLDLQNPPIVPPPALAVPPPRWEKQWIRQVVSENVFERTRRVEEFVRRLRASSPEAQKLASAAQRVVRKTARHEERPLAQPMQLRPASPAARPDARSVAVPDHAPDPPEYRAPQPAVAPSINIDALTTQVMDQIDRRVISWRERMGKF